MIQRWCSKWTHPGQQVIGWGSCWRLSGTQRTPPPPLWQTDIPSIERICSFSCPYLHKSYTQTPRYLGFNGRAVDVWRVGSDEMSLGVARLSWFLPIWEQDEWPMNIHEWCRFLFLLTHQVGENIDSLLHRRNSVSSLLEQRGRKSYHWPPVAIGRASKTI